MTLRVARPGTWPPATWPPAARPRVLSRPAQPARHPAAPAPSRVVRPAHAARAVKSERVPLELRLILLTVLVVVLAVAAGAALVSTVRAYGVPMKRPAPVATVHPTSITRGYAPQGMGCPLLR